MAFPNKYRRLCDGNCKPVGGNRYVPPGEGFTEGPPWKTYCKACALVRGIGRPREVPDYDVQLRAYDAGHLSVHLGRRLNGSFDAYRAISTAHACQWLPEKKIQLVRLEKARAYADELRKARLDLSLTAEAVSAIEVHAAMRRVATAEAEKTVARILGAGCELYPFQKTGVAWLAERDRAILADEMGLGKTIQNLAALPRSAATIVVCPAVAKGVWQREAQKWRPDLHVTVLAGKGAWKEPEPGEIVVLNYDILPERPTVTCAVHLLADEAHALKNYKAKRTERFACLADSVRRQGGKIWLTTATPLLGRPSDLWSLSQIAGLAKDAWGSWANFKRLFDARDGYWGGIEWGDPASEVRELFSKIALRRLRKDVLPELPGKTWQDHPVDLRVVDRRKIDKALGPEWETALESALADAGGVPFERFSLARKELAMAKTGAALEVAADYEDSGEPLIIFSAHTYPLEALGKRPGWATITGETKPEERAAIADRFQRGELVGLAGNIQAAGVALTLTRACHVLFVDQSWTPALNAQAEDRVCRIGQSRGVVVHRLVADHALDRRVCEVLDSKMRLIRGSLGA